MNYLMKFETWDTVNKIKEILGKKPDRNSDTIIIGHKTGQIDLDYKYNPKDINKDYYIPSRWKNAGITLDTSTILKGMPICTTGL